MNGYYTERPLLVGFANLNVRPEVSKGHFAECPSIPQGER
jgi:hypothetical protein